MIDRVVETPGLIAFDPARPHDAAPTVAYLWPRGSSRRWRRASRSWSPRTTTPSPTTARPSRSCTWRTLWRSSREARSPSPDTIHYNTYPMERSGRASSGNGAIDASSDDPARLFKSSRQKNPGAVVEVNHPRAGDLGYFNNFYLDLRSAETALAPLSTDFDVLEVMNGPYYYSSNATRHRGLVPPAEPGLPVSDRRLLGFAQHRPRRTRLLANLCLLSRRTGGPPGYGRPSPVHQGKEGPSRRTDRSSISASTGATVRASSVSNM